MSQQLLVAVKSSLSALKDGRHDVIRSTWGQLLRGKAILKFFVGKDPTDTRTHYLWKSDEVQLDVRDDFEGSVQKTRGICQYMMGKRIDHILLLDAGCIFYPERLFRSGYQIADYAGEFNGQFGDAGPRTVRGEKGREEVMDHCYSWAKGGGYVLSMRAAMEVADTIPRPSMYGYGGNEDLWVGQILGPIVAQGDFIAMPLEEKIVCVK